MTIFDPQADPYGDEKNCRVCGHPLVYDSWTRDWYCPLVDHEPEPEPEEPEEEQE